jgi:hypothetical protein
LELERGWAEGARERERERERDTEGEGGSSKPVVVVMNVADPHITTKWNIVGEGRKENRPFFNAPHLRFYYLHHPFLILLSTFIFVFL